MSVDGSWIYFLIDFYVLSGQLLGARKYIDWLTDWLTFKQQISEQGDITQQYIPSANVLPRNITIFHIFVVYDV